MYQELYEKLGLGESNSPVFSFSGESTVPLGKTTLLVLTGPVNLQTEFIMIQAPSLTMPLWKKLVAHDEGRTLHLTSKVEVSYQRRSYGGKW